MYSEWKKYRRHLTRRRSLVGLLSVLAVIMLVAAACGEEATPTPVPQATARPQATATPIIQVVTATPVPTGIRPMSEWTADDPATFEEIEAELEKHKGESLVFVSWGGAYQAAQRQAYLIPFEAKFGISIIEESPVEFARIRAQVESGNVTWHSIDSGTRAVYQLGPTGDLAELDPAIQGNIWKDYPDVVVTKWSSGGGILWSTGLAVNTKTYPPGSPRPSSWADFWDVEKFPGRRSLGDRPNEQVFFAYFAAHPEVFDSPEAMRAVAKLTDAQLDESFEKLREIKPDIQVWWHTGSDCPSLLIADELDMCSAWNGRLWDPEAGAYLEGVDFVWEAGHLLQTDVFYTPRGNPNLLLTELFFAWTGFPQINVEMSNYITYGPLSLAALPLVATQVDPRVVPELPTSPKALPFAVILDEQWMGTKLDVLVERFQEFLAE
ncbi:MAG: extracellular solute-binding protein [Dehalococcoidia bacterium]